MPDKKSREDLESEIERLRENEQRYRRYIEHSPHGVFVTDGDGSYLDVNNAASAMTGYSRDELLTMKVGDFSVPDHENLTVGHFSRLVNSGASSGEIPFRRKNGTIGWWSVDAVRLDENRYIGYVTDVSEKHQLAERLKRSTDQLTRAQEIANLGSWEFDFTNGTVSASETAKQIYGLTDSELTIARVQQIALPEYRDMLDAAMHDLMENGTPYDVEFQIRRPPDNRIIWIRSIAEYNRERNVVFGTIQDITRQKRIEQKLQGSEERYQILSNAATEAIFISRDGICIDQNLTAERLFGYTLEEAVGRHGTDWIHPDDRPFVAEKMRQDSVGPYEITALRKDGSTFPAVIQSRNTRLQEEMCRITALRDISARKKAQNQYRESESRFLALVENAPEAIFVETGGIFRYVNKKTMLLFGAESPEQIIGSRVTDRLHPDYREEVLRRMHTLRVDIQSVPLMEEIYLRFDGTPVNVEVSAVPIQHGGENGALVFVRDISERKKTQELIEHSEQRLTEIINGAAIAMIVIDAGHRVTHWNSACEVMTGIPAENMIGTREQWRAFYRAERPIMADLVVDKAPPAEFRKYYGESLRNSALFTGAHESELFFPDIGEKGRWLFFTASGLYDQDGVLTGAVETLQDVTDRKRAEEEREKLQAQLNQAQKMESIGRLAGGVAHDFNNLLTVIVGNSELALLNLDPRNDIHRDIMEIKETAERATQITRQLLAFSRKQTIAPRPINLNEIINAQKKMLGRLVGEDVRFIYTLEKKLWNIEADPYQIDQILMNFSVNARDAISGVGTITIETRNVSLENDVRAGNYAIIPGDYVTLVYSDSGEGMDAETRDRIFEPFFTTKDESKGTGLGLATVYGIVKQNNGYINVYSEPGVGTTFTVYFPRYGGEEASRTPAEEGGSLAGTETILLVEDEPNILTFARKVLDQLGYDVIACSTTGDVIQYISGTDETIHLLLTDVVMPTMNGRELQRTVEKYRPDIRTIFMSGYTADVIAHHGVLDDGIDYIQKPFGMNTLAAKVREVLDRE